MREHLSFSALKQFSDCEAEAIACFTGKWNHNLEFSKSTHDALLVGSYVHKFWEGKAAFDEFIAENDAEMIAKSGKNKGQLKSDFVIAGSMIAKMKRDRLFSKLYQGDKEFELRGQINGIEFLGYADCLNMQLGRFIDIKTIRGNLQDKEWSEIEHRRVHWIEAKKYHWQMAIYQHLLEQIVGIQMKPVIYAVTKEEYPDSAAIRFPQEWLDEALIAVCDEVDKYIEVLDGRPPERCERCNYCKSTKMNRGEIFITDLV